MMNVTMKKKNIKLRDMQREVSVNGLKETYSALFANLKSPKSMFSGEVVSSAKNSIAWPVLNSVSLTRKEMKSLMTKLKPSLKLKD